MGGSKCGATIGGNYGTKGFNWRNILRFEAIARPYRWNKIPNRGGRTLVNGTGYDVKLGGSLTWLLNDYIGDSPLSVTDAGFISNDTHFAWLFAKYQMGTAYILYSTGHAMSDQPVVVYANRAWKDQAYRTLTFDEEPTGDLLAWLEANGTRQ